MIFVVTVGQIQGHDVHYDEQTYEFSVEIDEKVFRAKSFPGLQRLVAKSKEVTWEKVIEVGWDESAGAKVVSVTLRGNKYYEFVDGKLHSIESYNLYEMDEDRCMRLTAISNEIRKLKDKWHKIKGELRRVP